MAASIWHPKGKFWLTRQLPTGFLRVVAWGRGGEVHLRPDWRADPSSPKVRRPNGRSWTWPRTGEGGARARRAPVPCTRSRSTISDAIACSRSEEHTSELPSLMRISYDVFCLKKKIDNTMTNGQTLVINAPKNK